jgi:hypothetical protein
MSFTADGFFEVTIKQIRATMPRFKDVPQPAFDLVFDVVTDQGQTDSFPLEVSSAVVKGGKHQSKTRWQVAYETLQALGYTGRLIVDEIAESLRGQRASVSVKADVSQDGTKTFYNVNWIGPVGKGGGRLGDSLTPEQARALSCQMFPQYAAAQPAAPVPAAAPVQQAAPAAPIATAGGVAQAQPVAAPVAPVQPVQTQPPSPFAGGGFA